MWRNIQEWEGKEEEEGKGKQGDNTLSYTERKQRRIAKKFGINGMKLGDDEEVRVKLEDGKRPKGKPRVAGSMRGRELRAAAALARFGQQQTEGVKKEDDESDSGSGTESHYEGAGVKLEAALDFDGTRLVDARGNGMIKVCEDEDENDVHVKEEMQEFQDINDIAQDTTAAVKLEEMQELEDNANVRSKSSRKGRSTSRRPAPVAPFRKKANTPRSLQTSTPPREICPSEHTCPICSMTNEPTALLCQACSHVLDIRKSPQSWKCPSSACADGQYMNAADCGLCGICGSRKPNG